jgi:hypothetical protein
VRLIGQEANNIDEVQAGRYAQLDEIISAYPNPADDHLRKQVVPILDRLSGRENSLLWSGPTGEPLTGSEPGRHPRLRLALAFTELAEQLNRTGP